jgi:hypothetical protein
VRPRLRLRIGAQAVQAELVRRGRVLWAAEASHAGTHDLAETIAQLVAEPGMPAHSARVYVELTPPIVQLRTLEGLPPVRASALPVLVANESARFFRRNGKPLVTDAVWVRGPKGGARIARAAAVEEPWIEAIIQGAAAAGLVLEWVGPPAPSGLVLFTEAERVRRLRRARSSIGRLAVAAVLLWVAIGLLVAFRIHREQQRIDARLAALAAPMEAVLAARRELAAATSMIEAVDAADRDRRAFVARLGAILNALPDSAYLGSLALDARGDGSLTGSARRSVEVIEHLERTAAVASPELDGPAVREPRGSAPWERFVIRFGIRSTP